MKLYQPKSDLDAVQLFLEHPENEHLIDLASYHLQQAVEKCLKYMLYNIYGMDENSRKYRTHNITQLCYMINKLDADFLDKHQDLLINSYKLTTWEAGSRYDEKFYVKTQEIENTYKFAMDLYNELVEYERNLSQKTLNTQNMENIKIEDYNSKNFKDENKYINTNIKLDKQEKSEIDNINNDLKEEDDNLEDDYEL